MSAIIKGLWQTASLICGNHPGSEDEVRMDLKQGPTSLFYACPKYDLDKRDITEKPCFNRISLKEFEAILEDVFELLTTADQNNTVLNLVHHTWSRRGVEYKILSHTNEEIRIQVLNRRALAKGH